MLSGMPTPESATSMITIASAFSISALVEIETRRVKASIRTGGRPGEILIGPSAGEEDYVFVVDEDSGDVSVIHIPAVLHKRGDAIVAEAPKPVFAMFHGGAEPQSAVIVPYSS